MHSEHMQIFNACTNPVTNHLLRHIHIGPLHCKTPAHKLEQTLTPSVFLRELVRDLAYEPAAETSGTSVNIRRARSARDNPRFRRLIYEYPRV